MAGSILRILALCIAAALVCVSIRATHPQIASAVALAAGIGALILSTNDIGRFSGAIARLEELMSQSSDGIGLIRICGIALIAEFASDICRDSGESALARRIDTGVKIGILASALPSVAEIILRISEMLE